MGANYGASKQERSLNMADKRDLVPGDVLLMHNPDDWISEAIVWVGGGDYSHAAFYAGKREVEVKKGEYKFVDAAIEADFESISDIVLNPKSSGVRFTRMEDIIQNHKYVHVFRPRDDNKQPYSPPNWADEVIKVGTRYHKEGTRYGFSKAILLGLIVFLRKQPKKPIDRKRFREALDECVKKLADWHLINRKAMICSELVYRCFYEAEPKKKYGFTIDLTKAHKGFSLLDEESERAGRVMAEDDEDSEACHKLIREIERLYSTVNPEINALIDSQSIETGLVGRGDPHVLASCVTPYDLQISSNLKKAGELSKDLKIH